MTTPWPREGWAANRITGAPGWWQALANQEVLLLATAHNVVWCIAGRWR